MSESHDQISASEPKRHIIMYFWWAHQYAGRNWSKEERWLRTTVYLVMVPIWICLFLLFCELCDIVFINYYAGELVSACVAWIAGLAVSRWLCGMFWPDRVRQAEENAGKRYGYPPVRW